MIFIGWRQHFPQSIQRRLLGIWRSPRMSTSQVHERPQRANSPVELPLSRAAGK